jgi:hypothetical protein
MTDRAYTVQEIDALRMCCRHKYLWGHYSGPRHDSLSRGYQESDMITAVEEMVRTHMLAGHTADDLKSADHPSR